MKLKWFVCDSNPGISDLSPLDGNPLTLLWLPRTKVSDLSPLKGMRLTWLSCESTQITDFAVLKDLPLTELSLDFKPGRDSELLRSIKSLQRINNKPAVEFWKEAGDKNPLFFKTPGFEQWAKDVAAMPAEQQVEAVRRKLMDLNPGFDGKMTPTIENGVVRKLQFLSDNVTDISPVRGLPRLNILSCGGSSAYKGKLADLTPLEGMRLTTLSFGFTQVSDLSPLRGMPLVTLFCGITNIEDLSPLQGMKLVMLHLGMTKISDLSPLRGMPLMQLTVNLTKVSNLSPLEGMALTSLNCSATKVSDLTPLSNMPLKDLNCDFKPERDTELLRSIKTLETINSKPAAEFWKEFEEQQKGKKLGFQMPGFDQWVKDVQAMPAEKQVEAVSKKLVELNPEFDGKVTAGDGKSSPKIENGVVTEFGFVANFVTDISPVRALAGLKVLMCYGSENQQGRLSDLSPLEGMRLQNLICFRTQVSDLSPVRGMPLGGLVVYSSKVSDVAPLEGLPLEYLDCSGLELAGLTPLTECKNLRTLIVRQSIVNPAEITVLQKALPNCKIVWEDPAMSATSPPQ